MADDKDKCGAQIEGEFVATGFAKGHYTDSVCQQNAGHGDH